MFYRQYRNVYLIFRFHTIIRNLKQICFHKDKIFNFYIYTVQKKLNIVIKVNQHIFQSTFAHYLKYLIKIWDNHNIQYITG